MQRRRRLHSTAPAADRRPDGDAHPESGDLCYGDSDRACEREPERIGIRQSGALAYRFTERCRYGDANGTRVAKRDPDERADTTPDRDADAHADGNADTPSDADANRV